MITEPCVIYDMDEAVYHSDPVKGGSVSQSSVKMLLEPGGPARFRYQQDHPREDRAAFSLGRAAHALVLGAGAPLHRLTHADMRTKAAKEERAEAEAEGFIVLRPDEHDQVIAMADAIGAHDGALNALDGEPEVSMFAPDGETGVWMRGRADVLGHGWIADYKTAQSANPHEFARSAARYGYHLQAAWYINLASTLLDWSGAAFRFVVQEKAPPYLVNVVELDADFLRIGHEQAREALLAYAFCLDTSYWPGYPDEATVVTPPRWLVASQEPTELDPELAAQLAELAQGDVT